MYFPHGSQVADRTGRTGRTGFHTDPMRPTAAVPVTWDDDGTTGHIKWLEVTWLMPVIVS